MNNGEPRMIAIRHDGQLVATSPATMQEIEQEIASGLNERVEVMRAEILTRRLAELQGQLEKETEKARIQKLEREIPTNSA